MWHQSFCYTPLVFENEHKILNSCANPVGSKFFFEARYKWGGLRHLYSEEHMKPTAAEQTGMKQKDFEALFSKYRRLVYRAAYGVAGNKRDAEDALQSLFLKLIDQGFSEDSVRDPAGYLYRAAANEARQMCRARERRTRSHTADDIEVLKDPQSDRSRGEERKIRVIAYCPRNS